MKINDVLLEMGAFAYLHKLFLLEEVEDTTVRALAHQHIQKQSMNSSEVNGLTLKCKDGHSTFC